MLAVLLREHRGPLARDLHHYHGLSLARISDCGLTLWEVAAFVAHLPPDSATLRAVDPRMAHTHDLELLRSVDLSLRWLVWAKTRDGAKGRNHPEPYLFPWESDPSRAAIRGDAMTTDEADKFLGWKLHAV